MSEDTLQPLRTDTTIEPKAGETCKVVRAEELAYATDAGWVLRGVITEDEPTVLFEPMSPAEKDAERLARSGSYGSYNSSKSINGLLIPEGQNARQVLARRVKFVVCRPEASALAEWSAKYDGAVEAGRVASRSEEEAHRELRKAAEDLAASAKKVHEQEKELNRLRDSASWQHDRANALERDIGKIRESIGSQRMTEILGSKKT